MTIEQYYFRGWVGEYSRPTYPLIGRIDKGEITDDVFSDPPSLIESLDIPIPSSVLLSDSDLVDRN